MSAARSVIGSSTTSLTTPAWSRSRRTASQTQPPCHSPCTKITPRASSACRIVVSVPYVCARPTTGSSRIRSEKSGRSNPAPTVPRGIVRTPLSCGRLLAWESSERTVDLRGGDAVRRVLPIVIPARGTVHWRADFDWTGLRTTAAAVQRYGAGPWRISLLADCGHRRSTGRDRGVERAGRRLALGPGLATVMANRGRAVMVERLIPLLLLDLQAHRSPGVDAGSADRTPS